MKRILYCLVLFFLQAAILWAETITETKIDVFPPIPYDQAAVYMNLGFFWAGIIGLIVIINMKLKEIERIQRMGSTEKEEKEIPLLD